MKIEASKITGIDLLHVANSFTTGKDSKQTLKSAYRARHSTIRTQIFLIKCYGIPQYTAYHLRTHFSLSPMAPEEYGWMKSKRIDRNCVDFRDVCRNLAYRVRTCWIDAEGNIPNALRALIECAAITEDIETLPDSFDRYAPTDFGFLISAEGLITLAEKRLCIGAVSKETREVVETICEAVKDVDPDLYPHLVKPCIAHGGICRERCCGFNKTELFEKQLAEYKKLFI